MCQSLTYDRGREMAERAKLTHSTGVKVYFYDPYSPWQRGSNPSQCSEHVLHLDLKPPLSSKRKQL